MDKRKDEKAQFLKPDIVMETLDMHSLCRFDTPGHLMYYVIMCLFPRIRAWDGELFDLHGLTFTGFTLIGVYSDLAGSAIRMTGLAKEILSKLDSKKLIIPSISVGNVPQLTTDLLLHNFDFEWVSSLDVTYLYPFASPVDYTDSRPPKGQVCTGLELYVDDVNGLALIQQRSPILPGFGKNFLDYMIQLIQSVKFSQVVILDSNDCTLRSNLDRQSPIDVYSNDLSEQFKKIQIGEQENEELSFSPYVKALINSIKDFTIMFALVMFVYEGDNLFDSQVFATRVVELLKLTTPSWKKPKSWEALYGDRPLPLGLEEGIYG